MVFGTLERAIAWSLTNPLFMLLKFYLIYLAKGMMLDSFFLLSSHLMDFA